MGMFSIRGFSTIGGAAGGTLFFVLCNLWNPDSTARIRLHEMGFSRTGISVGSQITVTRTTTRGTGQTQTPDADSAWTVDDVPNSGAEFVIGNFTANPTLADPPLAGSAIPVVTGSGGAPYVFTPVAGELWIPPGTGVAITMLALVGNTPPVTEVYAVWEEGAS